jgi:hypothetical protein
MGADGAFPDREQSADHHDEAAAERDHDAAARDQLAGERDHSGHWRDQFAQDREQAARQQETAATQRDRAAAARDRAAETVKRPQTSASARRHGIAVIGGIGESRRGSCAPFPTGCSIMGHWPSFVSWPVPNWTGVGSLAAAGRWPPASRSPRR